MGHEGEMEHAEAIQEGGEEKMGEDAGGRGEGGAGRSQRRRRRGREGGRGRGDGGSWQHATSPDLSSLRPTESSTP